MLESIKKKISSLPDETFSHYFVQYMMTVQDTNIDKELHSYSGTGKLGLGGHDIMIAKMLKELKNID